MGKISPKVVDEILWRFPGRNQLDFGGDMDCFMDPESFSRILYHSQIWRKLILCSVSQQIVADFDEIFWMGRASPRDQSVRFQW